MEEFQKLIEQLEEPFHTMALVCVCFGLRISECLALKWADVDWLNGTPSVERGIVHQVVDDMKTPESQRSMCIDSEMLEVLKSWKQQTDFSASDDWMFASPSANRSLAVLLCRSVAYPSRSGAESEYWSPEFTYFPAYAPLMARCSRNSGGVQQRLIRHTDIRTTMNVYGTVATADMRQAHAKIVRLALPRA